MIRLANCPFCGSTNLDDTCKRNNGLKDFYFVFCNQCECEGPTGYDQATAIYLWNQRNDEQESEYESDGEIGESEVYRESMISAGRGHLLR